MCSLLLMLVQDSSNKVLNQLWFIYNVLGWIKKETVGIVQFAAKH